MYMDLESEVHVNDLINILSPCMGSVTLDVYKYVCVHITSLRAVINMFQCCCPQVWP